MKVDRYVTQHRLTDYFRFAMYYHNVVKNLNYCEVKFVGKVLLIR